MTTLTAVATDDIGAGQVHDTIARHMLADGFELVLDLDASRGSQLVDARTGTRYLDLFTFFASSALGMNHPELADDQAFLAELAKVAVNKPSNSDIYTVPMARFVETFARVLGDPALPHLFFVDGGALAVENSRWPSTGRAAGTRPTASTPDWVLRRCTCRRHSTAAAATR
jgi:L-lysine 6-transaminase